MPFVNKQSTDQLTEPYPVYEHTEEPSFSEVFGASVGRVIDEDLSISSALNREGWASRKAYVDEKIRAGEIQGIERYRTRNGQSRQIDYGRIAEDLQDPAIKTDAQLREERSALLEQRRNYGQDVMDRGSGMAQFLGTMNAYIIDPINIATVGIAAPATAAKATSVIGRAAFAARNAALIEGATELGIQTFVYQHKDDIDSPYSAADALANIGFAATGGAALAGAAGGLGAYFSKVRTLADELPQTPEIIAAKEYIERQEAILKMAPAADTPELQTKSDIEFLQELDNRTHEYARMHKGIDTYQTADEIEGVEPVTATKAEPQPKSNVTALPTREREILESQGVAAQHDADMAKFSELETATVRVDGEDVDAKMLVKQYDEEMSGLDDVLRCVYG